MKSKISSIIFSLVIVGLSYYPAFPDIEKSQTIKKEYYKNGKLKSAVPFVNGKKEGIMKLYCEDGTLGASIPFQNDHKDGLEKIYFNNGKLSNLTHYKRGRKDGKETIYFESGAVGKTAEYIDGKREGVFIYYFENGQISSTSFFKNGNYEGYSKYFYPAGIRHITFYRNGRLSGEEIEYDRQGSIIKKTLHDEKGNPNVIIDRCPEVLEKKRLVAEKTAVVNNKYMIFTENDKTMVVMDQDKLSVRRKKFDFEIIDFEACRNYPFINIESFRKDSDSTHFLNYIYDIETDRLYSTTRHDGGYREEKRWSDDGRYTFFNNKTSIIIIETKFLRNYLKTKDVPKVVEITLKPDGYIWQSNWTGNYLLYSAEGAMSWQECWGLYDLKNRKNYFVACSGMSQKNGTELPYYDFSFLKAKISYLASLIEKGKLIEISNDFRKEVVKITGAKDWEEEK